MLWVAAFVAVIVKGSQIINADGDLPLHLAVGNYILDYKVIPLHDVFSHTMTGDPYTPHEWLAEIIYAVINRLFGLDGSILLTAVVIATAFWLVYVRSRRECNSFLSLILVGALTLLCSAIHWLARPHIFTFLLLAVWMIVLDSMQRGKPRNGWWLPLIMLVWVNLHGAYIAGIVTWGLYGFGLAWDRLWFKSPETKTLPASFWRWYILGGVAAILITLANPNGLGLWNNSLGFLSNNFLVNHTDEYVAPDFHNPDHWSFLVYIVLLVIALGLRKDRVGVEHLAPSAAWLAMSLYSVRNIPLFVIIAAPLLAGSLENILLRYSGSPLVRWILQRDENLNKTNSTAKGVLWPVITMVAVVAGLSLGVRLDKDQIGNNFDPNKFPVDAVNWLKENPQEGDVFNYYLWGGYLLYRAWPDVHVYIDGKIDFYGEEYTREYLRVINAQPGWEEILVKYSVDWMIVPVENVLAETIREQKDWVAVYADQTALVAHRK